MSPMGMQVFGLATNSGTMGPKPFSLSSNPKGPCISIVYTWALKGFLYPCFGAHVCTIQIPGAFGQGQVLPSTTLGDLWCFSTQALRDASETGGGVPRRSLM